VSRRTPVDQMDGRRVTLTPGTTLRFGSLSFVFTGQVEPVAGCTFTRCLALMSSRGLQDVRLSSEAS
jgi:hypothetical protein